MRVCNIPGCPNVFDGTGGRCPAHQRQARRQRSQTGNSVYASVGHRSFREAVLKRDPICQIPQCNERSTVADHYPLTRRVLVARGMNPNDPNHGRGLCATHHNRHTAATSPGGWNDRAQPVPERGGGHPEAPTSQPVAWEGNFRSVRFKSFGEDATAEEGSE